MLNFAIPGTGSSGHLGGGLLLAFVLGPHRAFLSMAAVLLIQALFFADGGLLAYGCNLFNLGFVSSFIVYPLFSRPLLRRQAGGGLFPSAFFGAMISLQLGALGVTLETTASGMTGLSFSDFALLMQPIHLAIGAVEGLATWAVASYVWRTRPELLDAAGCGRSPAAGSSRRLALSLAAAALAAGCILSWLASPLPDGLEWSLEKAGAEESPLAKEGVYSALADIQERTSILPDYGFPAGGEEDGAKEEVWPAVDAGTSLAGLVGAVLTCALVMSAGLAASRFNRRAPAGKE
jgi:cobalt/nickel transport system permease protein